MTSQYRRSELLRQYALLRHPGQCPDGVYVSTFPSIEEEWSGVLFLHKGLFAGSVLRFRIEFPARFPLEAPSIHFDKDAVIHPLVEPSTGRLTITSAFPRWDARTHDVSALLYFVKGAFKSVNMSKLQDGVVVNTEAWRLFRTQRHVFARLAAQCASASSALSQLHPTSVLVSGGAGANSDRLPGTPFDEDGSSPNPFDFRALGDAEFAQITSELFSRFKDSTCRPEDSRH